MGKMLDEVMTIEELSGYLKISKSTLYKLVREGKVPCQKIGRHWRFRKEAIDRWLEDSPGRRSRQAHTHCEKRPQDDGLGRASARSRSQGHGRPKSKTGAE